MLLMIWFNSADSPRYHHFSPKSETYISEYLVSIPLFWFYQLQAKS